jgi:LPXTG-motif cell wall-anchored protein
VSWRCGGARAALAVGVLVPAVLGVGAAPVGAASPRDGATHPRVLRVVRHCDSTAFERRRGPGGGISRLLRRDRSRGFPAGSQWADEWLRFGNLTVVQATPTTTGTSGAYRIYFIRDGAILRSDATHDAPIHEAFICGHRDHTVETGYFVNSGPTGHVRGCPAPVIVRVRWRIGPDGVQPLDTIPPNCTTGFRLSHDSSASGRTLPFTGGDDHQLLGIAAMLLTGGIAALALGRRRRIHP